MAWIRQIKAYIKDSPCPAVCRTAALVKFIGHEIFSAILIKSDNPACSSTKLLTQKQWVSQMDKQKVHDVFPLPPSLRPSLVCE